MPVSYLLYRYRHQALQKGRRITAQCESKYHQRIRQIVCRLYLLYDSSRTFVPMLEKISGAEHILLELTTSQISGNPDIYTAVVDAFDELAVLYITTGKPEKAEKVLQKCFVYAKQSFGREHEESILRFIALACFYQEQNQSLKASSMYEEALAMQEISMSPNPTFLVIH